jgi:hypothetical protein
VSPRSIWDVLGISESEDEATIRRAYAARLKVTHPEDDAEGFQELRAAYDHALWFARRSRFEAAQEAGEAVPEAAEAPDPTASPAVPPPLSAAPPAPLGEHPEDLELRRLVEEVQEHERRFEADALELQRLLSAKPFDRNAAFRLFGELLASPALHNIGLADSFEPWVERILIENLPNADVLIPVAIRRFGWRRAEVNGPYRTGDSVLARDEDLIFIRRVTEALSPHREAWFVLSRPLKQSATHRWRADLYLQKKVVELLRIIEEERPGLMVNLSPESVAWWKSAPGQPRMMRERVLVWTGIPLAGAFVAITAGGQAGAPIWVSLLTIGGPIAAALAVLRAFYRQGRLEQPPTGWLARWGWALGAVWLLLAAAVATGLGFTGPWVTAGLALPGIGLAYWAARVAEPDRGPDAIFGSTIGAKGGALEWPWGGLLRVAPLAIFWTFLPLAIDPAAWRVLTVALLGAFTCLALGVGSLSAAFLNLARSGRVVAYGGGVLGIAGIAAVVTFLGLQPTLQPLAAVLVAAAALLVSPIDVVLSRDQRLARTGMMLPILLIFWVALQLLTLHQAGALRINGLWVLTGVALTLWHALKNDTSPPRPKPQRLQY